MNPEFRVGEIPVPVRLTCTECGGLAEGNCSWTDGSGEVCDKCVRKDKIRYARILAKRLRNNESVSYCDSIICFRNNEFVESHMAYGDEYYFHEVRMSWLDIRKTLKNGHCH